MKKDKQKISLNFLTSGTSVKKGYSSEGAIWKKSSNIGNNFNNAQGALSDVNSSTGIDDNSRFSLDPSGNIQ